MLNLKTADSVVEHFENLELLTVFGKHILETILIAYTVITKNCKIPLQMINLTIIIPD